MRSQGPLNSHSTLFTLPVRTLYLPWLVRAGSVLFTLVPTAPGRELAHRRDTVRICHELVSCLLTCHGFTLGLYQFPRGGGGTEDECLFLCHSSGYFELFCSVHAYWVVFLNFVYLLKSHYWFDGSLLFFIWELNFPVKWNRHLLSLTCS